MKIKKSNTSKVLFLLLITLVSVQSFGVEISINDLDVEIQKEQHFVRTDFKVKIYNAIAVTDRRSKYKKVLAVPGVIQGFLRDFCKEKGFDKLTDFKQSFTDSFEDVSGNTVHRYRYGKLREYTVPNTPNELMGTEELTDRARKFLEHSRIDTKNITSWNDIQDIITMPFISVISCEKVQ